jgi:uncharacterized RDD family membrane protein YckC
MTEQPPPAAGIDSGAGPWTGAQPAELLPRFLARLIDNVLLAIVNGIIVTALVIGAVMGESGGMYYGASDFAAAAVSAVLGAAISLAYFAYLESERGQTVGKMVMRLRTVGPDGANPTLVQAARRNIWVAFGVAGIVPMIGGLVGALATLVAVILIAVGINRDTGSRRGWHDAFAGGTQVVKAPSA